MQEPKPPRMGRVTSVFTRNGRIHVTVQRDQPATQDQEIPFASLTPGSVLTPQEGDLVEIYELQGGGTAARFSHNTPSGFSMPEIGENEMVFKFDSDTEIRVQKDDTGTYEVHIAGPKVIVDSGTIELGPEIDAKELIARLGDAVEVTDPMSGTLTGTITEGSTNVKSS